MTPKLFGAQIRARRREQRLEMQQFAKMVGISPQHLVDMERGVFEASDERVIVWMDEVLDCPHHDRRAYPGFRRMLPKGDLRRTISKNLRSAKPKKPAQKKSKKISRV